MIDWHRVDVVLLDMDGTLLDLHFDNFFWSRHLPRRYAELKSTSIETANARIDALIAAHRSTLNWYCLDFWAAELDVDIVALKREVSDRVQMRPGCIDFLAALKSSGRAVWLVTNAHRSSVSVKMERENIAPWFDHVVSSHDHQAPKEDRAFWSRLHNALPFDSSRALLIDDSAPVLDAAARFGIGQLLTIARPDSQQPERDSENYPNLRAFSDILPIPALIGGPAA